MQFSHIPSNILHFFHSLFCWFALFHDLFIFHTLKNEIYLFIYLFWYVQVNTESEISFCGGSSSTNRNINWTKESKKWGVYVYLYSHQCGWPKWTTKLTNLTEVGKKFGMFLFISAVFIRVQNFSLLFRKIVRFLCDMRWYYFTILQLEQYGMLLYLYAHVVYGRAEKVTDVKWFYVVFCCCCWNYSVWI